MTPYNWFQKGTQTEPSKNPPRSCHSGKWRKTCLARVKKLHMLLGLSWSPFAFQLVRALKRTCRIFSNSGEVPARLSWMVAVNVCPSALSVCALPWLLWQRQRLYRKPSTTPLPFWLPNTRPVYQTHAPSIVSPRDSKITAKNNS